MAGISVGDMAAVVTIAVAVSGGLTAAVNSWMARRRASGRVSTSEASVLWQQSQEMRAMLLTEKTRAEDQRDKLIAAYTDQVLPALTETREVLRSLTANTAEILRLLTENNRLLLEGGSHEAAGALAAPQES